MAYPTLFRPRFAWLTVVAGLSFMKADAAPITIVAPSVGSFLTQLAIQDLRRYLYIRTGEIPTLATQAPAIGNCIVLLRSRGTQPAELGKELPFTSEGLTPEEYRLQTVQGSTNRQLYIVGGTESGLLYGVYRYCELLGIRFYLQGDVVPDARLEEALPNIAERGQPLFSERGLVPFHDFPEGPDWWSKDDYRVHLSQMAKLRFNLFALHCYPEDVPKPNPEPHAEPLVWIGRTSDQTDSGQVRESYPAFWASTSRERYWGYDRMKTDEFSAGASQLFSASEHAHPIFAGISAQPEQSDQENLVFERAATFFSETFKFARSLGIKTCIGTETPLTVPQDVRARLQREGLNPDDPKQIQELYTGMFRRIAQRYPVDYYWLWTPESWTWSGNSEEQYKATVADIRAAFAAQESLHLPFQLLTCGWVLGPVFNRTALDQVLRPGTPMSSISREVGHDLIDGGFKSISSRPKWAIPWLENDQNLTAPQLWVGRMRYDAVDARNLGCSGLLGVHWRTKILAPAISALAQASWDQSFRPVSWDLRPELESGALHTGHVIVSQEPVAGVTGDEAQACRTVLEDCQDIYVMGVPNGRYRITLLFNETEATGAGQRVFDVSIQDQELSHDIDIFARAGRNRALRLDYDNFAVGDSPFHLNLTPRQGKPSIAACGIEGRTRDQQNFSLWINLGGEAVGKFTIDYTRDKPALAVRRRGLPVADFYEDFCRANFGEAVAERAARIFTKIDGLGLPQTTHWDVGPGGIKIVKPAPGTFDFIAQFASLRPDIVGAGNIQRFDYWLNTFSYQQTLAELGGLRLDLDSEVQQMLAAGDPGEKSRHAEMALNLRLQLSRNWERMMTRLLSCVETTGELGTVANLEQHNRRRLQFLSIHDAAIEKALGRPLPPAAGLTQSYLGRARLVVPTVRTERFTEETIRIPIIALATEGMSDVTLHWRPWGAESFHDVAASRQGRAIYEAILPGGREPIEYFVSARSVDGTDCLWPVTAPRLCQTVITLTPP